MEVKILNAQITSNTPFVQIQFVDVKQRANFSWDKKEMHDLLRYVKYFQKYLNYNENMYNNCSTSACYEGKLKG